jgi:hypothetical protein
MDHKLPQARNDSLLVHDLANETLVYDLKRHRAHSLNRSAALVWRHCDGRTTTAEMAALLERELNLPADEELVLFALKRLQRARLLGEPAVPFTDTANPSRRALVRRLGLAGSLVVLVPLIESLSAPPASAQGSCLPAGSSCTADSQCCSDKCNGSPSTCKA